MAKLFDKKLQLLSPKHTIIENIAANFAAEIYEVGRSQGMTSVYKDARSYAKAHFERFIPKAVEICLDMLARPDLSEEMKSPIYEAIMERTNDPMLNAISPNLLPPMDLTKFFETKVKPIIVNSTVAPELAGVKNVKIS